MKFIHVVVAAIIDRSGRILLSQRQKGQHLAGLWEFPGGKVEPGECGAEAVQRELQEEVGITVKAARPLLSIRHTYPDRNILLEAWIVSDFSGAAFGKEGQKISWTPIEELGSIVMPEANGPIINALSLPDRYWITPYQDATSVLSVLQKRLEAGIRLIRLRCDESDLGFSELAAQAYQMTCDARAKFLVSYSAWQKGIKAHGVHLSSKELGLFEKTGDTGILAASCHNHEELEKASELGCDFVTISPVAATASHPDQEVLGWRKAAKLLDHCDRPAFLLGGLTDSDLESAWRIGAQGVAGIRFIGCKQLPEDSVSAFQLA